MSKDKLSSIQGKKVDILEFSVFGSDNGIKLRLKIVCDNVGHIMSFYNVSRINILALSAPMEINGFEITSNRQIGWDRDSNYVVRDFEDNRISFFCEEYEIDGRTGDNLRKP